MEHEWKSVSHIKLTHRPGFPLDNSDSALTKLIETYFYKNASMWSQLPESTLLLSCSKEAVQMFGFGFFPNDEKQSFSRVTVKNRKETNKFYS